MLTHLICGYCFVYVCDIVPRRDKEKGDVFVDHPQSRYANLKGLSLHTEGTGPFCKFQIPSKNSREGVYALLVNGDVRYVGKCNNLSQRFNQGYGNISPRNCFEGGQVTNCRVNHCILEATRQGDRIELYFLETRASDSVERHLLSGLLPPWNRQRRA